MKILAEPLPNDQDPAFPNPLSTNHIVWVLYTRAQRHPWVVKNRVLTVTFSYYIIHAYKISRRLKINNYNINQIYKFQNFIGLNYA